MNVSFTNKQEKYIADQIDSGDFQNASEVVRDALRLHQFYRHKVLDELKSAIEQGWEGPASTRTVQDILQSKKLQKATE
ncbi:MAG: type II toxin-antitoxin system ParD family antitoxin [Balneola sp.]